MPEPSTPPPHGGGWLQVDVANAGEGVALTRKIVVADNLACGVLIEPFPTEIELPGGYYFARSDIARSKSS